MENASNHTPKLEYNLSYYSLFISENERKSDYQVLIDIDVIESAPQKIVTIIQDNPFIDNMIILNLFWFSRS